MNIKTEPTTVGFYAYDADAYCGCGCGECSSPIGGGITPQAAIDDLLEQLDKPTEPYVCNDFLATCRDPKRCHICLQPREAHERRLSLAEHCQEQPRRCPDCGSMARCKCGKEWERDE